MRIVCLLPGATILLYELGLAAAIVGRGERCVWPAEAASIPDVELTEGSRKAETILLPPAGVAPHEHLGSVLDTTLLSSLRPDVVILEERCPFCLAAYDPLDEATATATTTLSGRGVRLLSLHPRRLEAAIDQIVTVGRVLGHEDRAKSYWKTRSARLLALRMHVARYLARTDCPRPRVAFVVLEWPIRAGTARALGGWIPDMVDAGGGLSVLGRAGGPAMGLGSEDIGAADPEVLLLGRLAPDAIALAEPAQMTVRRMRIDVAATRAVRTWAVALEPHFAYAGPQLVEGVEALVRLIFPEALGANGTPPPTTVAVPLGPVL